MHWRDWLGIAAGAVGTICLAMYVLSIVCGSTKPSRVTWFVLTILGFAILASYRASGAESTVWVAVISAFGCLVIFLLSLKYGDKGWTWVDATCLVGAVGCITLLLIVESPIIALVAGLLADLVGLSPTIVKTYRRPWTESGAAWSLAALSNALNLAAVDDWRFSIWVYPAYMLTACLLVAALTLRRVPRPTAA